MCCVVFVFYVFLCLHLCVLRCVVLFVCVLCFTIYCCVAMFVFVCLFRAFVYDFLFVVFLSVCVLFVVVICVSCVVF